MNRRKGHLMPTPLFAYHAAPSALPPEEVHARLTADPALLTAATADAVRRCATGSHRFALRACALPTVTAALSGPDEPGSARIGWEGAEERTGWPAMTAWLVVSPRGAAGSRITLVSTRAPATGLLPDRLQRAHARRLLAVSIQSFLHAVVEQVESVSPIADAAVLELVGADR